MYASPPNRPSDAVSRQRGFSLIEALAALVVLGFGTVAVHELQGHLRFAADDARQRSEAVRLAGEELEDLRAFTQMAAASGVRTYAGIGNAERLVEGVDGGRSYRVSRRVDDGAVRGVKSASVVVRWTDLRGTTQQIALDSMVASGEPMFSGALALAAGTGVISGAASRAASIPVGARRLGGGRSVWKTSRNATVAFLFDDASGRIVGRCTGIAATTATADLEPGDLGTCDGIGRLWLSGTVRFTAARPPIAAEANEPPLDFMIAPLLSNGPYAATPDCTVEASKTVRYRVGGTLHVDAVPLAATPGSVGVDAWDETGERFARYACAIAPRADGRWSGTTTILPVGWTIGGGAGERRVCRFAADADGSGAVDANAEHPAAYVDVAGALRDQNFLVVAGDQPCPTAPPVSLSGDGPAVHADLGTVAHQP
ncbi:MAG: prepilin-type N-terminal cleavage/methylation domain-containing protein [Caldimonas sp.]